MLQCEAKGEKPIGILWNMNNKRLDANVDPRDEKMDAELPCQENVLEHLHLLVQGCQEKVEPSL